jgi:hypothetical protein
MKSKKKLIETLSKSKKKEQFKLKTIGLHYLKE